MYRKRNKKNLLLSIFLLLIVAIGIGYAYLTSELYINGDTEVVANTWNIHFENYEQTTNSTITPDDGKAPIISGINTTEISYEVEFKRPGDVYEFTVDVKNDGTIDAMVQSIQTKIKIGNGEEEVLTSSNLPSYMNYSVTYSDGLQIEPLNKLKADESETILVRVEFKKDITTAELDEASGKTINFTFELNYIQADDTAEVVGHTRYVYTVNVYDKNIEGYNKVYLNQPIPEDIIQYSTLDDALNDFSFSGNDKFCLKHKVVGDIVTESYVVLLVTLDDENNYEGMKAGIYELRGEDTSDKPSGYISQYYEQNKEVLREAFGYSENPGVCHDDAATGGLKYYSCSAHLFQVLGDIMEDGNVSFHNLDFAGCSIESDGSSSCDRP